MPPSNADVIKLWTDSSSAENLHKNLMAQYPSFDWENCDKFVLYTKINRLKKKKTTLKQNHKQKQLEAFLSSNFEIPLKENFPDAKVVQSETTSDGVLKVLTNLHKQTVEVVSENRCLKREIDFVEEENVILNTQVSRAERKIEILQNLLEITNDKFQRACSYKTKSDKLRAELQIWEDKYQSLSEDFENTVEDLYVKKQKLQKQSTRNMNKKLKRREGVIEKKELIIKERELEVGEKVREIASMKEVNDKMVDKVSDLQKQKKNLLQKVVRLQKKSCNDYYQANLLEIESLKSQITEKDQKLQELEQVNALICEPVIDTFYDGKFCNEVRETIMTLVTECGVSQKKVNDVMCIVVQNLTGKTLSRLPSTGVRSRLLLEAKRVANQQVAKTLLDPGKTFTLHQDGTSKFHRHFQSFQLTDSDGKQLSLGLAEVGAADAQTLFDTFTAYLSDLGECITCTDKRQNIAKIVNAIISTMSDQGSVNHVFNEKFRVFREDLLPLVYHDWETFTGEQKESLGLLFSFFCKMHIFVNMASETDKCLEQFEKSIVSEGRNPFAFALNESGISRLVRTVSKALTGHGCEKSGVGGHFNTYLKEKDVKNFLLTFRGHRFNHLYHAAASTFYHLSDIRDFLSKWADPNELLKSIAFDVHECVYVAGIRALGLIDKVVTGPFWRLIETVPNALSLNTHLLQLKIQLEALAKDASPILAGECVFSEQDVHITKDCVYESLIAPSDDPVLESYTQMALELCFGGMLLILERQAKDQLPGGRYWNLGTDTSGKLSAVPTTNTVSERDFAQLDILMRSKPSAATVTYESIIMWTNNKTSDWLNSLPKDEHEKVVNEARTHAPTMMKNLKEKQQKLFRTKLDLLRQRQEKKAKQEERVHQNKVKLTQKVTHVGGVWTDTNQVEQYKAQVSETEFRDALVAQLQFRKTVLGSKGQKYHFQQQFKGKHFSVLELENNLKEVLVLNADEDTNEQPERKLIYKAADEVEHEIITAKRSLGQKIEENRNKVCISQQKEMLPKFLEDPKTLVGKSIKHKCRDPETGSVEWYTGKVIRVKKLNVDNCSKTEYTVKYDDDDDDDEWFFPLLKDMQKGDLIIKG